MIVPTSRSFGLSNLFRCVLVLLDLGFKLLFNFFRINFWLLLCRPIGLMINDRPTLNKSFLTFSPLTPIWVLGKHTLKFFTCGIHIVDVLGLSTYRYITCAGFKTVTQCTEVCYMWFYTYITCICAHIYITHIWPISKCYVNTNTSSALKSVTCAGSRRSITCALHSESSAFVWNISKQ